jgi:hypothetical protein
VGASAEAFVDSGLSVNWTHVRQTQKWSVGRAVCQPAPESGDTERVPPVWERETRESYSQAYDFTRG